MINMNTDLVDSTLIKQIVERVRTEYGDMIATTQLEDDITMCHLNGTPLDLQKLLQLPKVQFGADIGGIRSSLDRRNGSLSWGFVPVSALRK